MEMDNQTPLQHHRYPATESEYEAELTETENEFAEQLEAVEEKAHKEIQRYLLWGSLGVVVNISVFYLFNNIFGVEYQISNLIAWVFSVQASFWIDKKLVFKHASAHPFRDMGKFYGTRVFTYVLEALILYVGISLLSFHATITKVIGHGLAIFGNYFFSKWFIFNKKTQKTTN
ncbi:GtrA family protein [Levilactobacillus zymae]|jgi:Predicted membrane protein|uniref:Teichoic acid glycosylation protein n=2 Tax=Levilactobacillus zymae TaxID=267363 RepID=A0A1Y6JTW7_9LACO|nr:GtrA family protein [Levilactobacillus zymae]KRL12497.1 hypothetical protein FD38_GL001461 [Levilactobacillus zymae DSM 19395]SMS13260.1 Teichoic acid glycosylation protein [Levilactobacillus zymae]